MVILNKIKQNHVEILRIFLHDRNFNKNYLGDDFMKIFSWISSVVALLFFLYIMFFILENFFGDQAYQGNSKVYVKNYFEVVGLSSEHSYSTVLRIYGEPSNIIQNDEFDYYFKAQYEGIEFSLVKNKNDTFVSSVQIYSAEYRFGSKKIGVGSTRDEINKVYKGFRTLSIVGNGCGFIDRSTWLEFYFDENDQVNKIVMYENGP